MRNNLKAASNNILQAGIPGMIVEDVWPTNFWGSERISEVQRKVKSLPWARITLEKMTAEADKVVETAPQLPIEKPGWRHDFYSHTSGEHLVFDPTHPFNHTDPTDLSRHNSEAQHRAWVLLTHERTYRLMHSLALMFRLTGDEKYANWVRNGMQSAIKMFAHDEWREGHSCQALYFSTLYDAQVLLLLATTYDLMTEDGFLGTDDTHIRQQILAKGAQYQAAFLQERAAHNMTCYAAAALARIGRVLGRREWLDLAFNYPQSGFFAQLEKGLPLNEAGSIDGFWYEGTLFYHFYSLFPLVSLYESVKSAVGQTEQVIEARAQVERMFRAPAEMADTQLRLPILGDLGAPKVLSLSSYGHAYEYAAGQLDPDRYQPVLKSIYDSGLPRQSLTALAFGPDEVGRRSLKNRTTSFPAAGLAFLRQASKEGAFQAWVRSGVNRAGHDHFDRLTIGLHAGNTVVLADLGTSGYALRDFYAYCRSTLAHNTLMVDEKEQRPVGQGSLRVGPSARECVAAVDDAYPGVWMERKLHLAAPVLYIEDICRSANADEHRFSWLLHPYGRVVKAATAKDVQEKAGKLVFPPLPDEGVWQFLTNRRTEQTRGPLFVEWEVKEGLWLRLWLMAEGLFEYTIGDSPGNPMPDRRTTLLVRTLGKNQLFQAALEVHQGEPKLVRFPAERFPLGG